MMKRFALVASLIVLLSGCKDIMHVQTGYVADRDECRSRSENNVGIYTGSDAYGMNDKERNSALLQLFCECMKTKDWKVAGCPKPATPPAAAAATPAPPPAPPTVVVVQSPSSQPAVIVPQAQQTPAPVSNAAPAPVQSHAKAKKKKKKAGAVCTPPATCPAPPEISNSTAPLHPDQQLNNILQRQ